MLSHTCWTTCSLWWAFLKGLRCLSSTEFFAFYQCDSLQQTMCLCSNIWYIVFYHIPIVFFVKELIWFWSLMLHYFKILDDFRNFLLSILTPTISEDFLTSIALHFCIDWFPHPIFLSAKTVSPFFTFLLPGHQYRKEKKKYKKSPVQILMLTASSHL